MKEDSKRKEIEAEVSAILSNMDKEDFKKLFETLLNMTYPGLTLYVRDTQLSEKQIQSYYPKQIILEKSFIEGSSFSRGGVPTNCRYTILSSHMSSVDEMIEDAIKKGNHDMQEFWPLGYGLFTWKRNSHFMVLDIYQYKGKTQIMLLHLPDYELWKFFTVMNLLDDSEDNRGHDVELVQEVRKSFEQRCLLPPDNRISSPDILERWNFPLGMDDSGELFDINLEVPDYQQTE